MSGIEPNPAQRRESAKVILARHSSVISAASELGTTADALTNLFRRAGETASAYLARVAIPEGMRLRELTTRENRDGEITGRTVKTDRESDDPPRFEPVPEGHHIKGMSTLLGPQGEVRGQWVKTDQEKARAEQLFWEACESHVKNYKGIAKPARAPGAVLENFLTLYPLGDPHVGMLSWARETGKDFDLRIAERDLLSVVEMLVDRAPASKLGLLANVGDFFHIENDRQTTPNGNNKLDGDSRLVKFTEVGFSLMRRMIDLMLLKHEQIQVVNVRGNHDPMMACMLALWLKAVYEREPRVTILDNVNPFTYVRHGKNLLGFAHGDGAKIDQLAAIMATDRAKDWGETEYRFWATGHVHHLTRKEFPGCVVESFRTLATSDFWHHWKGYRSGNSLSAITFDAEYGEDVRVTVPLRRARDAA